MIHVIFISIVVGIAAKWLYDKATKKPETQAEPVKAEPVKAEPVSDIQEETPASVAYDHEEIIRLLGAEVKDKMENQTLVLYQGGYFWIRFSSDNQWMDISFNNFSRYACEHANRILTISNTVNDDLLGWKVIIDISDADGQELEPLSANLEFRLGLMGNTVQVVERVKGLLQQAFMVARYFTDKMSDAIKKNEELDEHAINDTAFRRKVEHAARMVELGHRHDFGEEQPKEDEVSVSALLKLFDDTEFGCLQRMKILCGERLEVCDDLSRITAFNIREYIRSQEDPSAVTDLSFFFEFEYQTLLVHLRKESCSTDKSLFYMINVTRSGSAADDPSMRQSSAAFRTLMEIRLDGAEADYWEAKFMIDDAVDKVEGGRENELTDEQRLLMSLTGNTLRSDLYWAKKYYNKECYFQSLFHFKRIFHYMVSTWKELDEKNRDLYFEVCFYIGFIYMELNMKDRAFYYLFHARSLNSIQVLREFTNCICNMSDPGAVSFIKSTIKTVVEELNKQDDEEQMDEQLMSFYRFLNRRLAYALIEMKEYDEADALLDKMIADDVDVEFAYQEKDFLKSRMQQEQGNAEAGKEEKKNND